MENVNVHADPEQRKSLVLEYMQLELKSLDGKNPLSEEEEGRKSEIETQLGMSRAQIVDIGKETILS